MAKVVEIDQMRAGMAQSDQERSEREALEKSLKPYNLDNMPYDRERVIQMGQYFGNAMLAGGYGLGKCLVLLKEHEDRQTFAGILEKHFGGIPERTMRHLMRFAQFAAHWPKFRAVFDKPGMVNKGLALLSGLSEPEIEEELRQLEETGQIAGLDDIELQGKTFAELKREVRKLRALRDKKYEALEKINDNLTAHIETLRAQRLVPGLEKAQKLLKAGKGKLMDALHALVQADFGLLATDAGSVAVIRMTIDEGRRILDELEKQAFPMGMR